MILCGQVTEQRVLYSALDAHIRHLHVTMPSDAVAGIHPELAEAALEMMRRNMGATVVRAGELDLGAPTGRPERARPRRGRTAKRRRSPRARRRARSARRGSGWETGADAPVA